MEFFKNMFSAPKQEQAANSARVDEVAATYQPKLGTFMRTLEYPEMDVDGTVTGRLWLEAGYDAEEEGWVVWQKSIRETDDVLTGTRTNVMSAKALFDCTSFVKAFDQMMTFETAQKGMSLAPTPTKTAAKLGGDYFRNFVWREGLMMSRSGRLYPIGDGLANASNYFDEKDMTDAKAFLDRMKSEQYVAVPITLPRKDWEKAYAANQEKTDQRLNALCYRYNNDVNNAELAAQVVGFETPEVLFAFLQRGFNPKALESNAEQHFNVLKAAIDRKDVDSLNLLAEAGLSFQVRFKDETPLEAVLQQKRYSHLHVMLSRDGANLANYTDALQNAPAVMAIQLKDTQAFKALYLEGLDFTQRDQQGYALIHHAFAASFLPAVYAWIDEGLSIDAPIAGTDLTGLSIARKNNDTVMADFAIMHGAKPEAAGRFPSEQQAATPVAAAPLKQETEAETFSVDMLATAATNADILAAAKAMVAGGENLPIENAKGQNLFEICWKGRKAMADFDRRALLPQLGALGADPTAQLSDGTNPLNRAVSGTAIDIEYVKAIAPFVRDANATDAQGNNILHTMQLNASETVGHSSNISAVLKLLPALDINAANNDGYSNLALAIRLNRSQTLKLFANLKADWDQKTKGGWSLLDIAFTSAAGAESVSGAPRADKITAASDATRAAVLNMIDRTANTGGADQKEKLSTVFNATRPDAKTLGAAMAAEQAKPEIVQRLKARGMTT